jgi:hypothetical protein
MCYKHTGQIDMFEVDLSRLDDEIGEDSLTDEIGKSLFCAIVAEQESQSPPDELARAVDDALLPRHETVARNAPQPFLRKLKNWTMRKLIESNSSPFNDEEKG